LLYRPALDRSCVFPTLMIGHILKIKTTTPWIIAVVALIAFGVSFSQLHKARNRYWKLYSLQSHDHMHRDVREFIIRAALIGLERPIIVLGDSITEMARLPEEIDGHPVVNAGIGGSSISDFETIAPRLLEDSDTPSLVVVTLGANDIGSGTVKQDYAKLLSNMKKLAPQLLAIGVAGPAGSDLINSQIKDAAILANVPFIEIKLPQGSLLPDHMHLNGRGYQDWIPKLVSAISGDLS
jgi:GDSL-like Lipase/Acylhydrolase family